MKRKNNIHFALVHHSTDYTETSWYAWYEEPNDFTSKQLDTLCDAENETSYECVSGEMT